MEEHNEILCMVCGIPANIYIGSEFLPVCSNVVCYHTAVEEVNKMLRYWHQEEVEVDDGESIELF